MKVFSLRGQSEKLTEALDTVRHAVKLVEGLVPADILVIRLERIAEDLEHLREISLNLE